MVKQLGLGKGQKCSTPGAQRQMFSTAVPVRATKICQQMMDLGDLLKPRVGETSESRHK